MFYLLYKEKNISSFKAIKDFANKNKIKKIGHTGTLDPLATGLLLVATDEYTKLISYIDSKRKTYITKIKFGTQTSTYDEEGEIVNTSEYKVTFNDLEKINQWFLKQIKQLPPIFSAKKINGIRAYDLARKNQNVKLNEQKITIFNSEILNFDEINQELDVKLEVSNGTYIRSLVNDVAIAFNTFAYMKELERISINNLSKSLLNDKNFVKIKYQQILPNMYFDSSKKEKYELLMGKTLSTNLNNGIYFARDLLEKEENQIYGIVEITNNFVKSKKLFGNCIVKEKKC